MQLVQKNISEISLCLHLEENHIRIRDEELHFNLIKISNLKNCR